MGTCSFRGVNCCPGGNSDPHLHHISTTSSPTSSPTASQIEWKKALYDAAKSNNLLEVKSLIESGNCDVNAPYLVGETPLHVAMMYKNIDIVRWLLEHTDCDYNLQDRGGNTPLHLALELGHVDIVRWFIEHTNCDINLQDRYGNTRLHYAVKRGHVDIVRWFIEQTHCDINRQDRYGNTPLHYAVKRGYVNIVGWLIEHTNCDIKLQDRDGNTPLYFAVKRGHVDIVRWFIDHTNCDINLQVSYGITPLHYAIKNTHIGVVRWLQEHAECDINQQDRGGKTPLHYAVERGHVDIVRWLLEDTNCDINQQDRSGKTPLHLAIYRNSEMYLYETSWHFRVIPPPPPYLPMSPDVIEVVRCLISRADCDINIMDNNSHTPLDKMFIYWTNREIIKCLTEQVPSGSNIMIQNILKVRSTRYFARTINLIKLLILKNVNLQLLTSDDGEIVYGQLFLEKLSPEARQELRKLMYLSGGSFEQITHLLHFKVEENHDASLPEPLRVKPREKFYLLPKHLSLKEICRRVFRQNTGLAINERISELVENKRFQNFLMLTEETELLLKIEK